MFLSIGIAIGLMTFHYLLAPELLKRWFWRIYLCVLVPLALLRTRTVFSSDDVVAWVFLAVFVSLKTSSILSVAGICIGLWQRATARRQLRQRAVCEKMRTDLIKASSCNTHNVYGIEVPPVRMPDGTPVLEETTPLSAQLPR